MRDLVTAREAHAGPGMDTRQWVSYGIVNGRNEDDDSGPIEFTKELGPMVEVTLQPSGIIVSCRVAGSVAGNGEGEYSPFLQGDEVVVLVPEGDEQAGCLIIGRCNNEIDAWPAQVAGQDATKNTFAFKRVRTPYIFETASSYLLYNATAKAFFSMSADGRITLTDAQGGYLALNPDFIGMQSADGKLLVQLDLQDNMLVLEANGTKLTLEKDASAFLSKGTLSIGTMGVSPLQHAATIEGMIAFLDQWCSAMATAISAALNPAIVTPSPGDPLGPLIGTPLAALFYAGTAPAIQAALGTIAAATIAPYSGGITGALSAKQDDPSGQTPGLGSPGILIG